MEREKWRGEQNKGDVFNIVYKLANKGATGVKLVSIFTHSIAQHTLKAYNYRHEMVRGARY